MTTSALDASADAVVRGILESLSDDRLVLALPHSDYRLWLAPGVAASAMGVQPGKRIKGEIHARALRMFKAAGGGNFIEPLEGAPRIVAGRVLHVDASKRRLLIDVAAPMWVTLAEGDDPGVFAPGEMVNCYVESGSRFVPA